MSNVIQEFSRFAHQYDRYNVIQAQVAKTLAERLPLGRYNTVLDIGCGSGEVFKNFQKKALLPKHFIALDSSKNMLDIHPEMKCITKVCADFNDKNFLDTLPLKHYDLLLSSSALQWSEDLDFTLEELSKLSNTFYAAIFTSGTFKTLHQVANINSPIYSAETLQKTISKYYSDVSFVLHHYTLAFDSVREMFQYIKKSGVSSGEKKLSYGQTKYLMENYPLEHLEFEVLFVEARN
ncbi:methyltransferase domain-containing protein [Sulfurovum sp.]|uniref:methyltransferase domain-containing protein n=1 Tax=Sulfurovum sp. TaxID=1969726 RepID=UPI0025FB0ED4|nr:methyltransferase domain-containing protein [Sulfurovum sp.]